MVLTKDEEKILKSIIIPSENNPAKPEFPPDNPKFPATPTYRIDVPGFSNVWLKDESVNLTGTHKDRMAWEMVVTYKQFLLSKKKGILKKLPSLSLLSSGSAALAIQTQLRRYKLPDLHVLMDINTDQSIINQLQNLGCKVYLISLENKKLDWEEILRLTENVDGFDVTSNEAYDPTIRFYDWMSYEIINTNADYIFLPFGTGQLYENLMNIIKRELNYKTKDPRFKGNYITLKNVSILGATSSNPQTKATKLYAPFLPFANYSRQWIKYYRAINMTGKLSSVYDIKEEFLDNAMEIAKNNKVNGEYSGISGLALLSQMKKIIPKDAKILIVNTGKTKLLECL